MNKPKHYPFKIPPRVCPHSMDLEFLTLSWGKRLPPIAIPASDIVDVRASTDDMLKLAERVDRGLSFITFLREESK